MTKLQTYKGIVFKTMPL